MSPDPARDRYASLESKPFTSTVSASTLRGAVKSLAEIARHREMLALLVRRDIRSRYKDSALGLLWSLIRPLTQLLIYYIVIGKFLGAERGIPEFAIFIFAGLTAYGLFAEIVSNGTASILSNAGIVKKVWLPREVFPLATAGSALFNFLMQLVILVVATIAIGSFPWAIELAYAVPGLLVVITWGLALALLLSALNVYLRDIGYLVEVLLLLLMWASPIVYSWEMARNIIGPGILLEIYTNNPITLGVLAFQKAFWVAGAESGAAFPDGLELRLVIAISLGTVAIFLAQRVFARLQGNFAQEL
jgi:ABC-2 type transport system permease protein